ncbi:MAG: glycosyltransferase family A protein [Victivallaceae bacterium]|nr:glycosyltransferase family A protein [Victivallaceae bacterium]
MSLPKNLHTFVISAWQESPYIEATLKSLLAQEYHSKVIIATSSPNEFLESLSRRYGVKYVVNPHERLAGSAVNWSFAYAQAETKYVTLAHQDDFYKPDYSKRMLSVAERVPDNLISFCSCAHYRNERIKRMQPLLLVKDVLLLPYYLKHAIASKRARRVMLSLGDPICCPTVMFNRERCGEFKFDPAIKVGLDWDAWLRLCDYDGSFVFCPATLLIRRMHQASGTVATYLSGDRDIDDLAFFRRFWPKPVASVIASLYRFARYFN